jgi:hypothetical protein
VRDHGATTERIRSEALAASGGALWLEDVRIETQPTEPRAPSTDMERLLLSHIMAAPPDTLTAIMQDWANGLLEKCLPLKQALPVDHPVASIAAGVLDDAMMEQARALLLSQLDA